MPDLSHPLTHASPTELARLHDLLDTLFTAKAVEPTPDLPAALARLQAVRIAADDAADGASAQAAGELPGTRAESAAFGLAGFGAASALLLQEQYGPPGTIATGAAADARLVPASTHVPAGRDGQDPGTTAPDAGRVPITEADWAAAGAQDHALLEALQDGGGLPATGLPFGIDIGIAAAGQPAAPDGVASALDSLIARVDGQLAEVAASAAFLEIPIQPAEVDAAAAALSAEPLPTLLNHTRDAAASFQQQVDVAVDVASGTAGADLVVPADALPEVAPAVELVGGIEQALPDLVDTLAGVLDGIVALAPDSTPVPLSGLVAAVLEPGASLPGLLDTLLGEGLPVQDLLTRVDLPAAGDLVQDVFDSVGELGAGVIGGAGELVAGVGELVADVGDVVADVGDVVGGAAGTIDSLLDLVDDGVGQVLAPVPGVIDAVGDVLVGVVDGLDGLPVPVTQVVEGAVTVVDTVVQEAAEVVTGTVDVVTDLASGVVDGVVGGVVGGVTQVTDGALGTVGAVLDGAGGLVGGLVGSVPVGSPASGGDTAAADSLAGLEALVAGVLAPGPSEPTVPLIDTLEQLGGVLPLQDLPDALQGVLDAVLPLAPDAPGAEPASVLAALPSLGTALVDDATGLLQGLPGLLKPGG